MAPDRGRRRVDALLWALSALALAATFYFSLWRVPPGANSFPSADKLLHAGSYFVLTGLLLLAAVWRPGRGDGAFPWAGGFLVGAAIALGTSIEFVQGTTLFRTADPLDALADIVGAMLAYVAWRGLRHGVRGKASVP